MRFSDFWSRSWKFCFGSVSLQLKDHTTVFTSLYKSCIFNTSAALLEMQTTVLNVLIPKSKT